MEKLGKGYKDEIMVRRETLVYIVCIALAICLAVYFVLSHLHELPFRLTFSSLRLTGLPI